MELPNKHLNPSSAFNFSKIEISEMAMHIEILDEVDSTNLWLKKKILAGMKEPMAVIAKRQTAGRGRFERKWQSPEGGLYVSISYSIAQDIKPIIYTVVAGIAVRKCLFDLFGLETFLKWPNDVILNGGKLAGMLSELVSLGNGEQFLIVGLGLNANEKIILANSKYPPIALGDVLNHEIDVMNLGYRISQSVYNLWKEPNGIIKNSAIEQWQKYAYGIGGNVIVNSARKSISGKFVGVSEDFELIVQDGKTRYLVNEGDCEFLFDNSQGKEIC